MATTNGPQREGRDVTRAISSEEKILDTDRPLHIWTVWHPEPAGKSGINTFEEHWNIWRRSGEVYWGVITDRHYAGGHPFEKERQILERQIEKGITTYLFVKSRDDQRKSIKGTIKKIITQFPAWREESGKFPEYYKRIAAADSNYSIPYWIVLSSIEEIEDPLVMAGVRKLHNFDSKQHGALGYPYPCACEVPDTGTGKDRITTAELIPWNEVEILFLNAEWVSIKVKGAPIGKQNFSFEELGFRDKRRGSSQPITAWGLLMLAAKNLDSVSKRDYEMFVHRQTNFQAFKKIVNLTSKKLSQALQGIFDRPYSLEGKAFRFEKKKGYKAQFHIRISGEFWPIIEKRCLDD